MQAITQTSITLASTDYTSTSELYSALTQNLASAVEDNTYSNLLHSSGVSTLAAAQATTASSAPAVVTNPPSGDNGSSGGLSGGAIAGIVIGAVAFVVLLFALYYFCVLQGGSILGTEARKPPGANAEKNAESVNNPVQGSHASN